jgi:predicted nucleotidyltransferase
MKKQIIDKLSEIGRKFDIVFLGVFGSFTRKDFTNKSDIDLLVA